MAGEMNFGLLNSNAPAEAMNSFYRGQQDTQNNALAQMQLQAHYADLQQKQRAYAADDQLRSIYAAPGFDMMHPSAVNRVGAFDPKAAAALMTLQQKMAKDAVDIAKTKEETASIRTKRIQEDADQAIRDFTTFQSPTDALANINNSEKEGKLPAFKAEALREEIGKLQPGGFDAYKLSKIAEVMSAKDRMSFAMPDANAKSAAASSKYSADSSAKSSKYATDTAAGTAANRLEFDKSPEVVAHTLTDEQGNVTQLNKFGAKVGTPLLIGKPSESVEKVRLTKADQVRGIEAAVKQVKVALTPGGLLDQSTGSGIGNLVDKAAGLFGQTTDGSVAIAQLQPISDMLLKMVPRFEGPQSDHDVLTYQQASGRLADPAVPITIRRAAAKQVLEIMERRKDQFEVAGITSGAPSTGWGKAKVVTP